jgi:hypothetical protein
MQVIERLEGDAHFSRMPLDLQPYEHSHHHASTHLGSVGFYSTIAVFAVAVLILFGLFMLAQNAMQGVAALFAGI